MQTNRFLTGALAIVLVLVSADKVFAIDPHANIRSQSAFSSAMNNLRCGDAIYLANGIYSGHFSIEQNCYSKPIIISGICSENVRFKGKFNISGSGIIISGLKTSSDAFIVSGDYNSIERNYIDGGNGAGILLHLGASNNVIANNDISRLSNYGVWIKLSKSDKKIARSNQIMNNYIHDFIPDKRNGAEAIQIGPGPTTTNWNTAALIQGNLVERVSTDSEIISLKASGNRVIGNTFRNSSSYVSFRHGVDNIFANNFVDIAHGVRIHGDNHQIMGNTIRGTLYIMSGDITQKQKESGHDGHPFSLNAVVKGNVARYINVGYSYTTNPRYPARVRSVTENNAEVRVTNGATGVNNGWQKASVAEILPLNKNQVGPKIDDDQLVCAVNSGGDASAVNTPSTAPGNVGQVSSISEPQSSGSGGSSGDVAQLKEDLRIAENRLKVAQDRYRRGEIPAKNVVDREAEVAAAEAALKAAQLGGHGQVSYSQGWVLSRCARRRCCLLAHRFVRLRKRPWEAVELFVGQ
jgi:hypothetical protein